MEAIFRAPCGFNFAKSNLAEEWKTWLQKLTVFLSAAGLDKADDHRKISILLHCMGEQGVKIYNTFKFGKKEIKFEDVTQAFNEHFSPRKNVVYERYKFLSCRQKRDQSIEQFLTELKNLVTSCEYKEESDMVRDVFVIGVLEETLKEKLIREENLTLEKAITIYKAYEASKLQIKHMVTDGNNFELEVNKINKRHSSGFITRASHGNKHNNAKSSSTLSKPWSSGKDSQSNTNNSNCSRCGQVHRYKCPAQGVKCNKCHKIGHFANCCKSKVVKILKNQLENVDKMSNCSIDKVSDTFFLDSLNAVNDMSTKKSEEALSWITDIEISGKRIKSQLDTGAQVNIISVSTLRKLKIPEDTITKTNVKVTTYTGEKLQVRGECFLKCKIDSKSFIVKFIVINSDNITIIGLPDCIRLNLIKRVMKVNTEYENILVKNEDLFTGLGCLKTVCHLTLKENAQPVVDPPRKVPFKLYERFRDELKRMEELNVIEKVAGPTEWVNSIVLVEKPNKSLRICLDPRNLNNNLLRSHFPLPDIESIKSSLNGASYFSTLDASSGFWMIKLDAYSSSLCTFNTPFGRYKFLRLPYGLNVAPEIFHKTMSDLFSDLDVLVYIDDILVWGKTKEEHDSRLKKVLERARQANLKFNKSKCHFGLKSVKYYGHIFSKEGVRPDNEKIKAILEMPSPTCIKDLQRFLGLINYLSAFVKDLSKETSPLRNLLKKGSVWEWNETYENSFKNLKALIANPPVLAYYSPNCPIKLSVDASQFAVGAVLLQNGRPLGYASKTLTNSQRNYAQIEKELYAILFGCKKFHQYIYGHKILVESDHKPLVTLSKKSIADIPARLQRMMLSLQIYDFEVIYKPGKELAIADTLSRAPLPEIEDDLEKDIQVHALALKASLSVSESRLKQIENETNNDSQMKKLKQQIFMGWPENKRQIPETLKEFWKIKDEIFLIDNVLFRNNTLIIPKNLRKTILKLLHEGHSGIVRTKRRARNLVYWPKMSQDIEKFVQNCLICQKNSKSNASQELTPHPIPNYPWEYVGTDIFEFDGKSYLLVVDYLSKFIEVVKLSSYNSITVIGHLKSIFARFGIPSKLISDNGPPFSSQDFKDFTQNWDIEHLTSSPNYPQSNGMAERSIQTIKEMLFKIKTENKDINLALLEYRSTPLESGYSPSQLLMCRNLRSIIPTSINLLKPNLPD